MRLVGYSDRLSARPGERIGFMVSCAHASYRADVVRLIHGDPNPLGPGFKEEPIETGIGGEYPGRVQPIATGSYVRVPDAEALRLSGSFTILAWIFPTSPSPGVQGLITKWRDGEGAGYSLVLAEGGALALWIAGGAGKEARVDTGAPVRSGVWSAVGASFDARTGTVELFQHPLHPWPADPSAARVARSTDLRGLGASPAPLLIAASGAAGRDGPVAHYNGKIDGPLLLGRAASCQEIDRWVKDGTTPEGVVAAWDFARETTGSRVVDAGPNELDGVAVNLPTRAVTGHTWTGREIDHTKAPREYGAIHFHDDDLDDAGWEVGFAWDLPGDLRSGVYAARLRAGDDEDHLPFVVAPPRGKATASVAYLIPTFTYLAYANEHVPAAPAELYPFLAPDAHRAEYAYIAEHRLNSLYDVHTDGSGVCYASWKRPLVNTRPKAIFRIYGGPERLGADLYLVDWLERKGFAYDAIADELVHQEGIDLLGRYRVLITGSHPEYWTAPMLDALQAYVAGGGRVMYLGGNGFYWVTAVNPERPHAIEIRRWRGTETWEAAPGEFSLSSTGELGGLWRNRNHPPQKLLGVGFTAQGNDEARPYVRLPDSFDPRAAWIFEGIDADEPIGDVPSLMLRHGAAGYEIDRADPALGTPPHALILATATGFSDSYQHVIEEVLSTDGAQGGTTHPLVRADMVYFEGPNGGGVFSVGSIAWMGALSANGYDNTVSRVTENVLRRFASPEPLPMSDRRPPR